ncbi:hypothetical protein Trydic_g10236, partial [Trypoxylus dichotomus]
MCIRKGAYSNEVDVFNCVPLHYSVIVKNIEIVELLLHNWDISKLRAARNNDTTIFHMSVHGGDVSITKMLLEKACTNAEVQKVEADQVTILNHMNRDGLTPLLLAIELGNMEMFEMLLEMKINVDIDGNYGSSPLFVAVYRGQADMVRLLLQRGANANLINDAFETPLHWAIRDTHLEIVELLLEHEAEVNFVHRSMGYTPLQLAILSGNKNIVNMLLRYNADVNLSNTNEFRPLEAAFDKNDVEIIRILL